MNTFKLGEYLTKFQTSEKEELGEDLDPSNVQQELNEIIDKLANSPSDQIEDEEVFDSLLDLCHGYLKLSLKQQTQLSYSLGSSIVNVFKEVQSGLLNGQNQSEPEEYSINEMLLAWKYQIQKFGYLIHVCLNLLQLQLLKSNGSTSTLSSKKQTNNGSNKEDYHNTFKNSCSQLESFLECIIRILEVNLSKIFQTTLEKDQFVQLFLKPVYLLLEIDNLTKISSIKYLITKVICTAVKSHNQSFSVQNMISTNLTYFVNLTNFMAELLQTLNDDYNYPHLTEDVLRDISNKDFNPKDNTGPKSISVFLIKLSELIPSVVLRQMTLLIRLLNNSSFTLRCAVVEVCGNIVLNFNSNANHENNEDIITQQMSVLVELLEERFLDTNPYVRTKAIQGLIKICNLPAETNSTTTHFNREKVRWAKLAVRSLQDKSSLVRRNCVKLLSNLVLTHPFSALHGSQLSLFQWKNWLASAKMVYNKMEEEASEDVDMDAGENDQELDLSKMKLTIKYHEEAIDFIKTLHQGIKSCCKLLYSKNKTEVIESMDFFVLADAYDIEITYLGIKKMLHLVWMKSSNEEGVSISQHLVQCYKQLFLTAPDDCNYKERAAYISKNLINLTIDASVADLASLEKLLGLLYEEKFIDHNVINVLWAIYNSANKKPEEVLNDESLSKDQIHGSIIIIGMLSLVDNKIALNGLDYLLNVGLNTAGKNDLFLSKYTCLALERSVSSPSLLVMEKSTIRELEVVTKLKEGIVEYTEDTEYYPFCEAALNALFIVSSQPDAVCSEIIKLKSQRTFSNNRGEDENAQPLKDFSRLVSLSQLLFIVGQVSIRMIVYLERCEADFKKRSHNKKASNNNNNNNNNNNKSKKANSKEQQGEDPTGDKELDMIGGTNEDDFADAVVMIKENELLFGPNSLLAQFGPLVEEIVTDNTGRFQHEILQRVATLCLEKMMCCSSKYCEKNLPLLITVMEKSPDPVIRSNCVLGLGDMAVCFNNLVDENTEFLYKRLHDENLMVQRTCLMTVTFLILAGQVKVKGQLGQMAKCLENEDKRISDMCKLFFTELASKDNAIYNGFIDIFSTLVADKTLSESSFKNIIQFLITFIDKERNQKQLSAKLFNRLKQCQVEKQWDQISFVINQFVMGKTDEIDDFLKSGFKLVSAKAVE